MDHLHREVGIDPFLQAFKDEIPVLQVFVHQVRSRELAANSNQIQAQSVEDYPQLVAHMFLHVGTKDPR